MNAEMEKAFQKIFESNTHYVGAPARFLAAWKKAIGLIGPQYFHSSNLDDYTQAADKTQLEPNWNAIERRVRTCSVGEGVLIGAVVSFYNPDWGNSILEGFDYPGLAGVANRLELQEMKVVTELMMNYTGW